MAGDFWTQATAAAQQLGRRALLVTGPALPPDLPEGVQAFPYVPYSQVFPRAAAVVHQAGIGTLAQRLLVGVPPIDPIAFGGTAALFAVVLASAAWAPARRAAADSRW